MKTIFCLLSLLLSIHCFAIDDSLKYEVGDVIGYCNYNDRTCVVPCEKCIGCDTISVKLKEHSTINIEIGCHMDYRGSAPYNLRLSQAYAQTILDNLVEKGIARDRMTAKGYGENSPRVVPEKGSTKTEQNQWKIDWGYKYQPGDTLTEVFIDDTYKKGSDGWEHAMQKNRRCEVKVVGFKQ